MVETGGTNEVETASGAAVERKQDWHFQLACYGPLLLNQRSFCVQEVAAPSLQLPAPPPLQFNKLEIDRGALRGSNSSL
jgi:hypothetical protein